MLDPAAGSLLVGCFALLFASAALHKLRAPARFAEVLRAYRIVPEGALRLAWLVAVAELGAAAGLLFATLRPPATLAGA
ncbi:MAG TPA: MauE/DoxX family redox-associated membrane protein, partial [Steroidobacteraceae bacterium]|nr:MauE/DoxX family redox-associated membrane protein [Steroidobacteraceae bacterium]